MPAAGLRGGDCRVGHDGSRPAALGHLSACCAPRSGVTPSLSGGDVAISLARLRGGLPRGLSRSRSIIWLPSSASGRSVRRRSLRRSKVCNAPARARRGRAPLGAAPMTAPLDFVPLWTLILGLRRLHVCADGRVRSRGRHSVPPGAERRGARPHDELGCADLGRQRDLARARRACACSPPFRSRSPSSCLRFTSRSSSC